MAVDEPGVTRIQLRLPQGGRLIRRFHLNTPIKALYKYCEQEVRKEVILIMLKDTII